MRGVDPAIDQHVHEAPAPPRKGPYTVLAVREIVKRFPGVLANDRISLELRAGEVHALLGENGAGKTTLVSILYGLLQPDTGQILLDGRPVRIRSPRHAIALGIGLVPQHFLLVRRHTVAENVALGLPGVRWARPLPPVERAVRELGERYGLTVDPEALVWQLSAGEQQRVEIMKALVRGARILILDEPTSVLTPQEAKSLFEVLRRMKAEGHAIVFISHKLDEVLAIADRITVLRRGRVVAALERGEADKAGLARLMVGREVTFAARSSEAARGEPGGATDEGRSERRHPVLAVQGVWADDDRGLAALRGVSFEVYPGEILGLAGIAGNGQRELVEVLGGLRRATRGKLEVMGKVLTSWSPEFMVRAGIAHIPEDRMNMGIVPAMSVAENLILNRYRERPFSRGPLLDLARIREFARRMIARYAIRAPGPRTPAHALSGGNVQKLILARELSGEPSLIIAAHPTYGLDVGATEQVHTLLENQRQRGAGILLVSEDLDELLALCDRIAVIFRGELMGTMPASEATAERLGLLMTGVRATEVASQ